jgi:regulatory protein
MLGRRDHFRVELYKKLLRKSFSEEQIQSAIDRCSELGLLDDVSLARRFVEFRAAARGWGPRRLELELAKRGVERALAAEASRLDSTSLGEALATALRRTELRAREGWWRLPERRARMVSSLIARGFEPADAIAAVSELAKAREREKHAIDDQQGDPIGLS